MPSFSLGRLHHAICRGPPSTKHGAADLEKVLCVLRYHPSIHRGFMKALNRVPVPPSLELSLNCAWRNALPSIASKARKHNTILGGKGRGIVFVGMPHAKTKSSTYASLLELSA